MRLFKLNSFKTWPCIQFLIIFLITRDHPSFVLERLSQRVYMRLTSLLLLILFGSLFSWGILLSSFTCLICIVSIQRMDSFKRFYIWYRINFFCLILEQVWMFVQSDLINFPSVHLILPINCKRELFVLLKLFARWLCYFGGSRLGCWLKIWGLEGVIVCRGRSSWLHYRIEILDRLQFYLLRVSLGFLHSARGRSVASPLRHSRILTIIAWTAGHERCLVAKLKAFVLLARTYGSVVSAATNINSFKSLLKLARSAQNGIIALNCRTFIHFSLLPITSRNLFLARCRLLLHVWELGKTHLGCIWVRRDSKSILTPLISSDWRRDCCFSFNLMCLIALISRSTLRFGTWLYVHSSCSLCLLVLCRSKTTGFFLRTKRKHSSIFDHNFSPCSSSLTWYSQNLVLSWLCLSCNNHTLRTF